MLILIGIFILLLCFGVPVAFCLFASSMTYMLVNDIPLVMVTQRLAAGPNSWPLLALSFFILAGAIMNSTGITNRIFGFADSMVGHLRGGLGYANVVASVIFSGMSGSAVADTGGLGAIELKAMKDAGYDDEFSLSVTGASSVIGPIIPPSIPAVIYAVIASVSVGRLFIGGIIPGLLMAIAISILIFFECKKKNYPIKKKASFTDQLLIFKKSFFPLLTPIIILGGIIGGIFTPTEAAIIAVVYALILGAMYGTIKFHDIPRLLKETLNTTIGILFIIANASLFGWLLTITQVPQSISAAILTHVGNKYLVLLIVNIMLFIAGCFLEPTAAMIILVPILLPASKAVGIDPIHFGIVVILNLMIGLMTPPVGYVLYVLSGLTKVSFESISRKIAPYIGVLLIVLLLVTYFPQLVLILPSLLFK